MEGTWWSFAISSRGAGMPRGDGPRLRVVAANRPTGTGGRAPAFGDARLRRATQPPDDAFAWRPELELVAPDVTLPPGCAAHTIAAAEGSLGLTFPRAAGRVPQGHGRRVRRRSTTTGSRGRSSASSTRTSSPSGRATCC